MLSKLKQLLKRGDKSSAPAPRSDDELSENDKLLKQLSKRGDKSSNPVPRFDDDPELSWLYPPEDPRDITAWDRYWFEHVRHWIGPALFDMFCDDRDLVKVMNAEGMKTVLCAGCGISQEPRGLAEAGCGFRVG